jgi:hypothetical protein
VAIIGLDESVDMQEAMLDVSVLPLPPPPGLGGEELVELTSPPPELTETSIKSSVITLLCQIIVH